MKIKTLITLAALFSASLLGADAAVTTIAGWTFENDAIAAPTFNPAPSTDNSLGAVSAASIGMAGWLTPNAGTNDPDVLAGKSSDTGANLIPNLTHQWRIRAQGSSAANGWSSQAPIGSQGAQFNVDTTGFQNLNVQFDWYATTQGEANLQLQYTTDGINWINIPITIPAADAGLVNVNNSSGSDANTVTGYYVSNNLLVNGSPAGQNWYTNLNASISDPNAFNNPNFGIRLVNASTGADCVSTAGTALNNTSGNWRFDNVVISGTGGVGTLLTPPALAVAAAATVDRPFTNTFTDSAPWRAAITNVTVNGITLPGTAYSITAGQIVFIPSANTNLQTPGTLNLAVRAAGYTVDTVAQPIASGAATQIQITQQPAAPTGNGGTLVVQPVLTYLDQYNNVATNVVATITASVGSGTWNFGVGSGLAQAVTGGTATFTNLSATSSAAVSGAVITFTATGSGLPLPTLTNSAAFNIPAPATTGFTPGHLAVLQEDLAAKNSTFSILELNPNTPAQSAPVNTFPISATGTNALRQSSAATTGRLADSNDGTLVCFTGFEDGSAATADETTIDPRGVGTLNATGGFLLQTSYLGIDGSGNQTRSATTVDDTNFFIGDKGGVYINNGTSPLIAGAGNNVRSLKAFGGTVYALQQSSSSVINTPISVVTGAELYPLDGFSQDPVVLDFYMIQSGANGTNYDTVYYIDGTNTTSGAIFKYYLTQNFDPGTGQQLWAFAGMATNSNGGDGLCAATNAAGGVDLYYTTGSGGIAGNSLIKIHDSAPDNTTLNLGAPMTLYTVSPLATLKGVAFAPVLPASAQPVQPLTITPGSVRIVGSGATAAAHFTFTNTTGLSFSVHATNNITAPRAAWPVIGTAVENPAGSGQYQFTDPNPSTNSTLFYLLSQP
jgi:hypothetical protein